jgi:hypothetical protein
MVVGTIDKVQINSKGTKGRYGLSLLTLLLLALAVFPGTVHAQITRNLEVSIPFQFHAGNAKLPAGNYVIHTLDDSDLRVMEIASADGSMSALFEVRDAEANSTPAKSELIFNKYGNRYFLAKVFDEGNPSGSEVSESSYEKKLNRATMESQTHIPAHHQGQQGN